MGTHGLGSWQVLVTVCPRPDQPKGEPHSPNDLLRAESVSTALVCAVWASMPAESGDVRVRPGPERQALVNGHDGPLLFERWNTIP